MEFDPSFLLCIYMAGRELMGFKSYYDSLETQFHHLVDGIAKPFQSYYDSLETQIHTMTHMIVIMFKSYYDSLETFVGLFRLRLKY